MSNSSARVIAFYLPQYHRIQENDEWWGEGFTDWTNVSQARPMFPGHRQPQIPSALGFYDLTCPQVWEAQADLARRAGIHGFCIYHYYFNGKTLLERPLQMMLELERPDFPFCLCWANENWTRRWDGGERHVLMGQEYGSYDPVAHMKHLSAAMKDTRYIRVNDKPLWLIYNPSEIPKLPAVMEKWRATARQQLGHDLHVAGVLSYQNALTAAQMMEIGFDSVVDFYPKSSERQGRSFVNEVRYFPQRLIGQLIDRGLLPEGSRRPVPNRYSYAKLVERAMAAAESQRRQGVWPCVMPSWDNTARRRSGTATIIQNDDPALFASWLEAALTVVDRNPPEERFVFINAWNEWAEGCHLEPDTQIGRGFLEATHAAIAGTRDGAGD